MIHGSCEHLADRMCVCVCDFIPSGWGGGRGPRFPLFLSLPLYYDTIFNEQNTTTTYSGTIMHAVHHHGSLIQLMAIQRRPSWKTLRIKENSKITEYACNNVFHTLFDENLDYFDLTRNVRSILVIIKMTTTTTTRRKPISNILQLSKKRVNSIMYLALSHMKTIIVLCGTVMAKVATAAAAVIAALHKMGNQQNELT